MNEPIDFRHITEEISGSHPEQNVFFLLDHGGLPRLAQQLQHCSTEWVSLFDHTKEEGALAVAPILVLAAHRGKIRLSRLVFDWLRQHGIYSSTVMILVSPLDLTSLANQLGRRLHVTLTEGVEVMLRFFDPRVFESLLNVMTRQQAEEFLCIASSWYYVDRTGRIVHSSAKLKEAELISEPLSLSQRQETLLLEDSEVDQILDLLKSNAPELLSRLPFESQHNFILESVVEGRKENLVSLKQLSLYTMIRFFSSKELMPIKINQEIIDHLSSNKFAELAAVLAENISWESKGGDND